MKTICLAMVVMFFCFGCSYHYMKAPDGTEIKIMRIGNHETKDLTVYKIYPNGTSFGLKMGSQETEKLSDVIKEGAEIAVPLLNPLR